MDELQMLGCVVGPLREMHENMWNNLKAQEERDVQWLR